ncbi:MAG: ABC transporter ATP-binding protein, partial [Actinomycetaceae bacterium]|nr:ABC transporter ATP-binding protein [Actinomycetaceae bacterium]
MSVLQPVTAPTDTVVRATNLTKTYGKADTAVVALKSVNVELGRGEFTAIMGPSGSGKSTLMHCLAGLDKITEGEVSIDGEIISGMTERKLTKLRRDRIGFIFQSFNLIPTLTAEENITLPADIAKKKVSKERFDKVVDAVGLRNRLTHRPAEMSGGQQQRVACARALITEPAVVFADEPTGNLDSKSSTQVLRFLREAVDDLGQTVVMVTHDPTAASFADRVLFLLDGRVIAQLDNPTRERVLDALLELDNLRETDETDDEAPATETEGGESDSPARRGGDGEEPAPTSSSSQADEGAASGSAAATQATPGTPGSTERATQATPA